MLVRVRLETRYCASAETLAYEKLAHCSILLPYEGFSNGEGARKVKMLAQGLVDYDYEFLGELKE